jgi:riboflavin synthase
VQGHVDAVGTIVDKQPMADGSVSVVLAAPREVLRYVVEKGSITVDGISLTVAALTDDGFSIAVIPHTLAVTTLGTKGPNDPVNLEVDVVAKYVERLMETPAACPNEELAACPNDEPAES